MSQGQQRGLARRDDEGDAPNIFPHVRGQQWPEKTVNWGTTALKTKSGRIFRKSNFTYPIWDWTLKFSTLSMRRGDWANLNRFFNGHAGQAGSWFYLDPYDCVVTNQPIGVGDGVTTDFQLQRSITYGGNSWTEPVFAARAGFHVYVDGVEVSRTWEGLGIVHLASAPAAGSTVSWTGVMYFLCHFTQDDLSMQQLEKNLFSNDGLSFETLKP